MKKIFSILLLFILFILIIYLFITDKILFTNTIIDTLSKWLYNVYPSLFVFYIISIFLYQSNILSKLSFLIKGIIKFESNKSYELLFISLFLGSPSSNSIIDNEYTNQTITFNDAKRLLRFSSYINPFFIIGLFSFQLGIIYLVIPIIINFIFLLFTNTKKPTIYLNNRYTYNFDVFIQSINSIIKILLIVCSIMVLSNILKVSIQNIISNKLIDFLLLNIEISTGLINLNNCYYIIFLISFNSLSINIQAYTTLNNKYFSFSNLFIIRVIQGILSVLLLIIIKELLLVL